MSNLDDFDFEDYDPFEDSDNDGSNTDDILDDFDDGDGANKNTLSEDEIERRLEAHEQKIEDYRYIITHPKSHPDVNERRDAVRWLGESGSISAIPDLVKVYQKDRAPGMKDEAAYALGQLKALELELNDPEVEIETLNRLEEMMISGKFEGRTSSTTYLITEFALIILAMVIFGIGGVLYTTVGAERRAEAQLAVAQTQTAMPTPTMDSREAVNGAIENYYGELAADADFFRVQMAVSTRAIDDIECDIDAFVVNPRAYTLTEMWAGDDTLQELVDDLNAVRETLQPIYTAYREACAPTNVSFPRIPRDDASAYAETILDVQTEDLQAINANLNEAGIEVNELVFSTPTPVPTDPAEATEEVTAGGDDGEFSLDDPILDLERLIDQMVQPGGPTTNINFYWDQVVTNDALYISGCNQPEPVIPEDFTLSAEYVGVSEDLTGAVENVNAGLATTRTSISSFYAACETGEVPEDADARLQQAQLAVFAFDTATELLNGID
ncbi:MAG: HEAT repeat domain-containing protein [Chloroflexota bacterium]